MSLVNKVLRDLDARHAAPGERASVPSAVTPLAARQAPPGRKGLWLAALLLVAAVAAAWWWLSSVAPGTATDHTPPAVAASAGRPAPATVAAVPPAETAVPAPASVAAVPPAPTSAPADSVRPQSQPTLVEPALRIDLGLATLPAEHPAPRAAPAVSKPKALPPVIAAAPNAMPARPSVITVPKEASLAPAAEPSINKQPRLPTAAERAEADYRRGLLAQRQGQTDEAVARYQAALSEYAEHAAARQSLAALLIELRRYDDAEALLRKGLALPPVRLASTLALARLKVERGQSAAALDVLLGNAAAGERSADYQGFTAALLNRAGRHREAAQRYQAAAQLAPGDGRWWAGLGIALDAEGKTAEAREAYQKASGLPGLPAELAQHIEQRLR